MKQTFINAAALGLLLISLAAAGEVYTYIDAQGNRVFTDQPPPGNAKPLQLKQGNRMSANPGAATPAPATSKAKGKALFHYQMLRVLVPDPDATIRNTQGELIVSVTSEPGLQRGHRYRLLLDGKPTADPGPSPVFALTDIDRGSHHLAVEILDEQGRMVERTPNQPFHMLRTSLAQKRQANPCTPADFGLRPECPLADKPKEEKSIFSFF
jgi:hypothetical protein